MNFVETTRTLFDRISETAFTALKPEEELNLALNAEDQTYIRFNHSRIRQASGVLQRRLCLTYQAEGRKLHVTLDLTGQEEHDLTALRSLLERARIEARFLPVDPFLVPMENNGDSSSQYVGDYPPEKEWIEQITEASADLDLAGLLAKGPQIRAVRNSSGQNHWFSTDSYFIDYSLFAVNDQGENKAVKGLNAGRNWRVADFIATLETGRSQLELLRHPARRLPPGEYRVYLTPTAMEKIVHMFSWGAVSYESWKNGHSALQKLIGGQAEFSVLFNLKENFGLGLAPRFNSLGEVAPMELPIIEQGKLKNLLVSSRSAKEFGIIANGADIAGLLGEGMRSAEVVGGELTEAEALKCLDRGLFIGNLHYLNWSDLHSARITGMTRYACFWVQDGTIAWPINDLRFDESLYQIFGSGLQALTLETPILPSTDTYHRRALGGCKVPGAIVESFRFTL